MSVHQHIKEVEEFACSSWLQLEAEKKELEESHQKFSSLFTALKENLVPSMKSFDHMQFSTPANSLIHSIFKEDEELKGLVLENEQDEKRKKLAEERKAEYNAFLEKKENELFERKKVVEEKKNVTPRSLLDFVDYEKILAKRKEEEARFRYLNHALNVEPNLGKATKLEEKSDEIPFETIKKNPLNENSSYKRTGGGGEPVRDAFGNVITIRGFKNDLALDMNTVSLPSMKNCTKMKNTLYKEELQRQIEEKRHLQALEKQQAKLMEEKISQRMEEQRKQMQMEYEDELKRTNRLKVEFERQQERIKMLEEFQKKDAEMRKRKLIESRSPESGSQCNKVVNRRSPSPPVPAVRTKELMERTITPVQVNPENLFSSLAEIRRQIMQDQSKLKNQIKQSYEVTNRRTVSDIDDDDDNLHMEEINCA